LLQNFDSVRRASAAVTESVLTKPLIIATAVLISFKLLLLAAIGPVFAPDSGGYAMFADTLLASRQWLHDAGMADQAVPRTAFRIIGYPAIIAAAKLLTGAAWPYAVIGVQFAASTAAFFAVYALALNLGLTAGWALAGALMYATSLQLTLDQCILSDSLNASAIILAVTIFLRGAARRDRIGPGQIAASGTLIVVAFLMREAMPFLVPALLPLFAIRCMLVRGTPWAARLMACVLVWLPLVAADAGYQLWNQYRTGALFVTTGVQIHALWPVIHAARTDPNIFSGDSPLDRHARQLIKHYDFPETRPINDALFKDGYRAPEIARMVMKKYLETWLTHPITMLDRVRIATSENKLRLVVRPITAVCDMYEWGERPQCFDYRDLYRKLFRAPAAMTLGETAMVVAVTIQNTLSIVLTAAYFIGIPLLLALAWRVGGGEPDGRWLLAAGFWLLGIGWHLIYAIASQDDRYMAPTIPFMIIGGLMAITDFRRRFAVSR
jgi:hypothetical protein